MGKAVSQSFVRSDIYKHLHISNMARYIGQDPCIHVDGTSDQLTRPWHASSGTGLLDNQIEASGKALD